MAYEVIAGNVGRNADELFRRVQASQFVASHDDQVCPAKWRPGAETLKPSSLVVLGLLAAVLMSVLALLAILVVIVVIVVIAVRGRLAFLFEVEYEAHHRHIEVVKLHGDVFQIALHGHSSSRRQWHHWPPPSGKCR